MSNPEIRKEENEHIAERLELVSERMISMREEVMEMKPVWKEYFSQTGEFLRFLLDVLKMMEDGSFQSMDLAGMKEQNRKLYENFMGESFGGHYETSFSCPEYAVCRFSGQCGGTDEEKQLAQLLSFLFAELQGLIGCVFEDKRVEITMYLELYVEIYGLVRMAEEEGIAWLIRNIREVISGFYNDYCEFFIERRTREMLDVSCDFAAEIICHADLNDLRYLYRFGEQVSENQLRTAEFLNSLPQEEIDAMAETFVEGFRLGFVNGRIDMSGKRTVNIRYMLGFERIVRAEITRFEKLNLKPAIYRKADFSINRRLAVKVGYYGGASCDQFIYDHRMDEGLYLDKGLVERKLEAQKKVYEKYRRQAKEYAGPACMEVFGEKPFIPKTSEAAIYLNEKQQKLSVDYRMHAALLRDQYIPGDQYSFTIIAYPLPEIGDKFPEIFRETVKVNTLSQETYRKIQQNIINVLDQGSYVRVTGKNGNRTNMKVMLHVLEDPQKQTNFENCVADVNIPVGEVFTSPVLKGTEGTLHVSEVYLEGLRYENLELEFKDGMITDYICQNYKENDVTGQKNTEQMPEEIDSENRKRKEKLLKKNRNYIRENILFQHETLPIGEFAIGTNTTAYRMGKEYGIFSVLPILIAEKTGPHFAVGDTCYSMSEDHAVYNPDGKEIIARENECSALRKTRPEQAYFNCHTDITIPYEELGMIAVYIPQPDGTEKEIRIIDGGKFVLPGTEELNKPLN